MKRNEGYRFVKGASGVLFTIVLCFLILSVTNGLGLTRFSHWSFLSREAQWPITLQFAGLYVVLFLLFRWADRKMAGPKERA